MSIRMARKVATKSNHHAFKMGATIVKGSRILAMASNRTNRACNSIVDKKWKNSLHAEAHAILHLLKHNRLHDLAGADLYVTRINNNGSVMMAKPCEFCEKLARSVGISRIFFTTNEETQFLKL